MKHPTMHPMHDPATDLATNPTGDQRWPGRRLKLALLAASMLTLAMVGCGDTEDSSPADVVCACGETDCVSDNVCGIAVNVPSSCGFDPTTTPLIIDGTVVVNSRPDGLFATCTDVIYADPSLEADNPNASQTATVSLQVEGLTVPTVPAVCEVGGQPAYAAFCTLRFDLAESCRGTLDSAEVVVNGDVVDSVAVDEPSIPCLFLAEGDTVTTTIRGEGVVLPGDLTCRVGGQQPRLTMECP